MQETPVAEETRTCDSCGGALCEYDGNCHNGSCPNYAICILDTWSSS